MNIKFTGVLIAVIIPSFLKAQSNTFVGKIVEANTTKSIPYVSIGIKGKPFGTIADSLGQFHLTIDPSAVNNSDTIIFSHVGYNLSKKFPGELKSSGNTIELIQNSNTLKEVRISAKKEKIEVYGRTPGTMFLTPRAYAAMPKLSDISGREQATILDVDKHILLKEINFWLIRNNYKKVKYRVNFYTVKNDMPDKLISPEDIIYETQNTQGWKNIDLGKYNIHLKGHKSIAVSLQLIEANNAPNDTAKTSFLIPSYPSPFKKSYFREKSESDWIPVKSSYLYTNIQAYKIKE